VHQFSSFGAPQSLEAVLASERQTSVEVLTSPTAFHGLWPHQTTHKLLQDVAPVGVHGALSVSMWLMLLRAPPKGQHSTVFYKGHGGPDRTPSLFLLPGSTRLSKFYFRNYVHIW
jgi:hypothetical protein